jgi:bacillithiol biosynthesis cysteine-adding enzyme BshC
MDLRCLDTSLGTLRQYGHVHSEPVAAAGVVRLPVDVRRLPWVRRLAADYAHDFPQLEPFFAGNPASADAWRRAIARAHAQPRSRDAIAALVRAQQQRRGAPPEAVAATEQLQRPDAVAVVTGQQAGLFGGPLFTVLKAVTALQLAEKTSREMGVPAVAVFWIDAEDHDWDEVRSCGVLDADLTLRSIALPSPPGAGERPVASIQLDGSIETALGELQASLAPTEFTPWLLAMLEDAYRSGRGMADAFGGWLERLLGNRGLIVFDSADPAAKPHVASLFARELSAPGRTARLAADAGDALVARGYHAQVTPHRDTVALFHVDGTRLPLRLSADRISVGDSLYDPADLARAATADPSRFSPNVLLRPLVQDTLFPTICYVAGPNELAYLGQLKEVYGVFDVAMPLIYPRATATVLDSAATRFLSRYDVPLEALQPQDEAALNRLLEAQLPPQVDRALEEARRATAESLDAVIRAVRAIDPTLEGAARSTLGKMEHDLQTLQNKVIQAAKRRDETLRRQFQRTRAQAFPDGHPQERTVGSIYFLNRFGPALIERLVADLPLDPGYHWVVTV